MAGTYQNYSGVSYVHINQALTQLSVAYRPRGFIAEQVFPPIPVTHESDDYYFWDKGQRFRFDRGDGWDFVRADGARAKQINFGATRKTYSAREHALETFVTDREAANQDSVLQLQVSKIQAVQDLLYVEQELKIAGIVTTTGNYSASNFVTLSGVNQWNNASFASQTSGQHSVIAGEIFTAKQAVLTATGGYVPNTIIIPYYVAMVMANDVGLIDLIKYTRPDLLVEDLLPPTMFGMKVLIPTGEYTTGIAGESVALSAVWGKNVWIGYVNPTPGPNTLTFGSLFRSRTWQTKQWRDEAVDTTYYRESYIQDEQIISADCGYLIQSCVA